MPKHLADAVPAEPTLAPAGPRRIEIESFGGPEVLHLRDFEPRHPGEGEVLVRTEAVGINPFEWKYVAGLMSPTPPDFPVVPGSESSGVIEAVGSGVEWAVGDEVVVRQHLGAYATHRTVKARNVWQKPASVSFVAAAVLPVAGGTAWTALRTLAITADDTLLIVNASGGVGSAAIQIARHLGARIIGTASSDSADYVRRLGAEPVAYGEGLAERVRALQEEPDLGPVTAILDLQGDEGTAAAIAELMPGLERVTTAVGGAVGELGVEKFRSIPDDTRDAISLAGAGGLVLEIASSFSLADAGYALALSRNGHVRGKLVLRA